MTKTTFTYENIWSSPRFWFRTNIGDFVAHTSLGLNLEEFNETKNLFRTSGRFKVSGDYHSIRTFGQLLEREYRDYISMHIDWDRYDKLID